MGILKLKLDADIEPFLVKLYIKVWDVVAFWSVIYKLSLTVTPIAVFVFFFIVSTFKTLMLLIVKFPELAVTVCAFGIVKLVDWIVEIISLEETVVLNVSFCL